MHPDQEFDPPAARKTRWFLVFLGIAGAVLLFLALMGPRRLPVGMRHPGVGGKLETLKIEPLLNASQEVTLGDLSGKVTLINCWGPWCQPCMIEMPELLDLEKKYRDEEQVKILLVAYPNRRQPDVEELKEDSLAVLDRWEVNTPIFHDPQRQMIPELIRAAKMDEFVFPTTVMLDRTGRIRGIWNGYDPNYVSDMGHTLELLIAESGG